ncbi:MAG TPA: tripartite tricarboxylate transporter substrate binding protein [Burkholderiales bacterium]|jgi:tripartite-type tricarboxylate transporter receptor subunit TctC|nr:tripartite tricarboxylate transporter substrate binding protein [Burkholderiales bacterium]
MKILKTLFAGLLGVLAAAGAAAQGGFPSRPITMVVGFAPGGGTDTAARIVAKAASESLGQSVVVENRAGAGGNIAHEHVAKAAPDGHTILLGSVGPLTVAPHMIKNLPYDPLKDLVPVTMAVTFANVLVVHDGVPVRTLADYIKLANDKPGTLTYGSSGIGGAGHLSGELFRMMSKASIVHVPYKGGGPAMQDLLGKQIASIFATPISAGPHIKAGKIRAIAVTSAQRTSFMPEVPTIAESGFAGFEATNWYAYVLPAKTPIEIVDRWNRELVKILNDPAVRKALLDQGMEPAPSTREQLAAYIKREYDTWARVVKEANITAN